MILFSHHVISPNAQGGLSENNRIEVHSPARIMYYKSHAQIKLGHQFSKLLKACRSIPVNNITCKSKPRGKSVHIVFWRSHLLLDSALNSPPMLGSRGLANRICDEISGHIIYLLISVGSMTLFLSKACAWFV